MGNPVRNRILLFAVFLFATAGAFGVARAGSLEPPGPVNSTMKPLSDIPALWKNLITVVGRFELVMGGQSVLDHETGLVWEQAPPATDFSWAAAVDACYRKVLGDRRGWRLPAVEEQATLATPGFGNPALPDGHPFSGSLDGTFWTITSHADDNRNAYGVFMLDGSIAVGNKQLDRAQAWCVRGGRGPDPLPATVN